MIRSLNLDPMFIPTSFPEIEFDLFKFNGGETHIKLSKTIDYSKVEKVIITNRIVNAEGIVEIMFAVDALKYKGINHFELIIPYMPYARQDRLCDEGESFTLKVFSNLINSLNFEKVYIFDSHSNVAPALLNNSIDIPNTNWVKMAVNDYKSKKLILVSPDAGSNKKCIELLKSNIGFDGMISCDKVRDSKNGRIVGSRILDKIDVDCDYMIVDDICDGGATFTGLANEFKKITDSKISLFVTHGIFSKGFDELNKYFDKIYCTNSFKDIDSDGIKQFKLFL